MGDPSYLRLVPSSSATIPIDWTKVPEASKKFLLEGWGTDYSGTETDTESDSDSERIKRRPLPGTISDLAKMFDESKFFGYMTPELCTLLLDISEFGLVKPRLTETVGLPVGPHFYMKYLSEIWFVLFVPGQRDGITGYSPEIPDTGRIKLHFLCLFMRPFAKSHPQISFTPSTALSDSSYTSICLPGIRYNLPAYGGRLYSNILTKTPAQRKLSSCFDPRVGGMNKGG
ncbi:uncharacterized protein LACBIDRAFT_321480 [Laccaria bicolor S238N-H82]|uniref:Predicted protein n=1 Tax=Laccaria bicolor (strain S238N-H82 / ATCC MYA-4686) TaxID=486041 RepID=B0CT16_LACBS|nr:uncharacterized protein LACBIDRAFT_321480 [Laccaria bicolor S238N-H82]EDR13860.1 predicted protein [Laccaria bicolor S238N-H82]|eukprot:XP_001874419.1 predicted protein [Laccaria bicolor S238N-H82]